ncbi:MAG TPA: hypothetical protein VMT87_12305, partial [Vicinamibacteria bacterium]|nr:hypothetical protein [Vicinamibacteria bacterium]
FHTLGAALDALSPGWRERLDGRALLPALARRLTTDAPADLVQIRPGSGGTLEADRARIERVWIDGRPAP